MTKVRVAPKSFQRWLNNTEYFLSNYDWKLEDSELDLETLFKRGVNPIDAHRMIVGVKNSPEEDMGTHYLDDVDTYILPLLNEL